jgi:hypothetical protein
LSALKLPPPVRPSGNPEPRSRELNTAAKTKHPQVGAPDPEKYTSLIVGEDDVEAEPNGRGGGCSFNSAVFALGDFVPRPISAVKSTT